MRRTFLTATITSDAEAFNPLRNPSVAAQPFVERLDPRSTKLNEAGPPAVLAHECSKGGLDVLVRPQGGGPVACGRRAQSESFGPLADGAAPLDRGVERAETCLDEGTLRWPSEPA